MKRGREGAAEGPSGHGTLPPRKRSHAGFPSPAVAAVVLVFIMAITSVLVLTRLPEPHHPHPTPHAPQPHPTAMDIVQSEAPPLPSPSPTPPPDRRLATHRPLPVKASLDSYISNLQRLRVGVVVEPTVAAQGSPLAAVVVVAFNLRTGRPEPADRNQGWLRLVLSVYDAAARSPDTAFQVLVIHPSSSSFLPTLGGWRHLQQTALPPGRTPSLASALTAASELADTRHLVYLSSSVVPTGNSFFKHLLEPLISRKASIVGCRVGVRTPPANATLLISYGAGVTEGGQGAVVFPRLSGYPVDDARASLVTKVPFITPHCLAAQREDLGPALQNLADAGSPEPPDQEAESLSGLHPDPSTETCLDIALQLGRAHVTPATVLMQEEHEWDGIAAESFEGLPVARLSPAFQKKWGSHLAAYPEGSHGVHLVWDTFCIKCFGFTNEVMHFVEPLEELLPVHIENGPECFCQGTPASFGAAIQRLHAQKKWYSDFASTKSWEGAGNVLVWVSHKDPGSFSSQYGSLQRRPDYVVGRSMYEFTTLEEAWIPKANDDSLADEIWVPSQFVWAVFKRNGIRPSKLVLIPEPVDVHFFDPRVVAPLHLPPRAMGWRSASTHPTPPGTAVNLTAPPYTLRGHFKFMSVFKWEERKGWDALLTAYFEEFDASEKVSLYLLSYVWDGNSRDPHRILGMVQHHAKHMGVHSPPHVEVVSEQLSEAEMAQMYRSVDAFVLPTRGEGWGLPIIQAMSMGLPTIATNWSGNVDFMREDNSYPVKVEKLARVPGGNYGSTRQDKLWAEPSIPHLRQLMRNVVERPHEARATGRRAREFVVANYADEVVAQVVKKRLEEIKDLVLARRAGRSTHVQ